MSKLYSLLGTTRGMALTGLKSDSILLSNHHNRPPTALKSMITSFSGLYETRISLQKLILRVVPKSDYIYVFVLYFLRKIRPTR